MGIAFISHPDCELHDTGAGHPESPARMRAVLDYLPGRDIWHRLTQYEAPLVDREKLYRVHDRRYVDTVIAAEPSEGRVYLDPDTSMAPHSRNRFSLCLTASSRSCGSSPPASMPTTMTRWRSSACWKRTSPGPQRRSRGSPTLTPRAVSSPCWKAVTACRHSLAAWRRTCRRCCNRSMQAPLTRCTAFVIIISRRFLLTITFTQVQGFWGG